jgi:hypothetical protein
VQQCPAGVIVIERSMSASTLVISANLSSRLMLASRASMSSFSTSASFGLPKARSRIELQATTATRSSWLFISSMSRRTAAGAASRASFIAVPYSPQCPVGLPLCPGFHMRPRIAGWSRSTPRACPPDPTPGFFRHRHHVAGADFGEAGDAAVDRSWLRSQLRGGEASLDLVLAKGGDAPKPAVRGTARFDPLMAQGERSVRI